MARSTRRERLVPHVVDGRERLVREEYDVPTPPRDWDQVVLNAVTVIAVIVLAASVTWTTASVGDLLGRAVLPAIAYGAASAFDLVWIGCMAVEWLARYEPGQARVPQVAGYVALLLSMTAVAVHGWWLVHAPAVGLVGAGVSLLAKGMWTVVLRFTARPLDSKTRQWFEQELAELNVQLGAIPLKRRAARGKALLAAEQQALGTGPSDSLSDAPVTAVPTPALPAVPAAPVAAVSSVNALPTPAPTTPSAAPAVPAQPTAGPTPPATSSVPSYGDPAVDAIRALYETGYRPGTEMMRDAAEAATGKRPTKTECRAKLRPAIELQEPHLKDLPAAPIPMPKRTSA